MYAGQFIRVSWLFSITGTDEVAETSLNFSGDAGWTLASAVLADIAAGSGQDDLQAAMATLLGTDSGWADYSLLHGTKIAAVGTDGHYLEAPLTYEGIAPDQGTTDNVPPQCTVVVSLRTGTTFGTGNYGRMYLPHYRMDLQNTSPYAATTTANALRSSSITFVNAAWALIGGWTTHEIAPVVMGQTGSGTVKPITQVGVGRLVDTQRRRRNRLDESTAVAPL